MRHRNSIRQLGRSHSHRKAMFGNMVTSLFRHERIITTKAKSKELKRISERLITRAKRNIGIPAKDEGRRLHNKREVMKMIRDREVVKKLFEDIALRFKDRNGGYTRIFLLGKRRGDAAEMSIVELVEKGIAAKKSPQPDKDKKQKKAKKEPPTEQEKIEKKEKKVKKEEQKKEKKTAKEKKETVKTKKTEDSNKKKK